MSGKRTLQELTIKDNFMFAEVMQDEENCRGLLELVLGIKIARVVVDREKSLEYDPDYHGVRLDVYAKDEENTHYNVEMQVQTTSVGRRSRYYHSQMDMKFLKRGEDYDKLPKSYVIFIFDHDPFGRRKYQYTVRKCFKEIPDLEYEDGDYSIFLSTSGNNADEVPGELVKFLEYVHANLAESTKDFEDDYVRQLQKTVVRIKKSREVEERYMVLEEMMRRERREGKLEGIQEGMQKGIQEGMEKGIQEGMQKGLQEGAKQEKAKSIMLLLSSRFSVTAGLKEKLSEINSIERLDELFVAAMNAVSLQDFERHLF